jgi:serine O-acetyltransferase
MPNESFSNEILVSPPSPWDYSSIKNLVHIWAEDAAVNGRSIFIPATQALFVYRFGNWVNDPSRSRVGHAIGLLFYRAAWSYIRNYLGFEIVKGVKLGRRVHFAHQHGIVIAPETEIGDDTLIHHGVTIGLRLATRPGESNKIGARIGRNVVIGAGAAIIGAVKIGDRANIGPNAVVMTNVPEDGSVVAAPSRILRLREQ